MATCRPCRARFRGSAAFAGGCDAGRARRTGAVGARRRRRPRGPHPPSPRLGRAAVCDTGGGARAPGVSDVAGPADGAPWDGVLRMRMLEHLTEPPPTLGRLRAALAPDGVVHVETPREGPPAMWRRRGVGEHVKLFTTAALRHMAGGRPTKCPSRLWSGARSAGCGASRRCAPSFAPRVHRIGRRFQPGRRRPWEQPRQRGAAPPGVCARSQGSPRRGGRHEGPRQTAPSDFGSAALG